MPKYSIIFFDLDGTLLLDDHRTISPRTCRALNAVHKMGTRLVVATGRARCILPEDILTQAPFDYCLSSNGGDVLDLATGEHIHTHHLSAALARDAYDILIKHAAIPIEWYMNNEIMLLKNDAEHILDARMAPWHYDYFRRGGYPVYETAQQYFDAGAPGLEKMNPLMRSYAQHSPTIIEALKAHGGFHITNSLGVNLEINAQGCTKGAAIRALCQKLGVDERVTLAFGDGNNDIEMLAACGTGVAMGNAIDALKAAANFVTAPNTKDGVAKFLEAHALAQSVLA